jgi:N utilization substance protein B
VKSKKDPRHIKRIKRIQDIFAWSCGNESHFNPEIEPIISNLEKIDKIIVKNAPKWPIDKINKIDLSILRYAVWEIIIDAKNPIKVIIDEVIEVAKEYGTEHSSSFVNGALGSIVKEFKNKNDETPA